MKAIRLKLIGSILCLATIILMASCNKDNNDDNGNESTHASIVGTWGCVNCTRHLWGEDPATGNPIPDTVVSIDSFRGGVVICNENGTYTSSNFWVFKDSGTWMKENNTLYIDRTDLDIIYLDNTILKLSYDEGVQTQHDVFTVEFKRQ